MYFYSGRGYSETLDGQVPLSSEEEDRFKETVYQVLLKVVQHLANKDMNRDVRKEELTLPRAATEEVVEDYAFQGG